MNNCTLHIDIFVYLLTLDKYYLPLSSFLALRTTCRRLRQLYTKQKYVDNYSTKIKVANYTHGNDNMDHQMIIIEYTLLPNGVKHGIMEEHYFGPIKNGYSTSEPPPHISMISKDFAGEYARRKRVARMWQVYIKDTEWQGADSIYYDSTTTICYYFGMVTGPKISTCKLLSRCDDNSVGANGEANSEYPGSNKIEFVELWVDNSMNVFYWYDGRLHPGHKRQHLENSIKDISSYHILGEEEGMKFTMLEDLDQNGDILYSYFRYGSKNVEITYQPEITIRTISTCANII